MRTSWNNACQGYSYALLRTAFLTTITEPGQTIPSQTPTHKEQGNSLFTNKASLMLASLPCTVLWEKCSNGVIKANLINAEGIGTRQAGNEITMMGESKA